MTLENRRELDRIIRRVFPVDTEKEKSSNWRIVTQWLSAENPVDSLEDIKTALYYVRKEGNERQLVEWYYDLAHKVFFKTALPAMQQNQTNGGNMEALLATLEVTFNSLLNRLVVLAANEAILTEFISRFHALTNYAWSISSVYWTQRLHDFFDRHVLTANVNEQSFHKHCKLLTLVGLQARAERVFAEVMARKINAYVQSSYSMTWDTSVLADLSGWVKEKVVPLVQRVLERENGEWESMLADVAFNAIVNLRIQELFDIIVDYPTSIPALNDLRSGISTPQLRAKIVTAFQRACNSRLLHPGASTSDIILQYMSTIHAFRLLDAKGVLLDRVTRPIRRYLRERRDTVSCIIHGLVRKKDSPLCELADELNRTCHMPIIADENDFDDPDWYPDPIDTPNDYRKTATVDVIGSLITLYDGKEVFVKELQQLFASRLLGDSDCDFDKQVRLLELLKLRFGEQELAMCDVMLQDITDSHRLASSLHADAERDFPLFAQIKVLSALYWPTLRSESLNLPAPVKAAFTKYQTGFEFFRADRKLNWLPSLGNVDVIIELEDRKLEIRVSSIQASLIHLFQDHNELSLDALTESLGVGVPSVKSAINFWRQQGVLKEVTFNNFVVMEQAAEGSRTAPLVNDHYLSANENSDATSEEMRMYWSFVVGMLTNLGNLPLDRIQSMLKMFVPTGYTKTEEQLREFLNLMIEEEKLDFVAGAYKLRS